MIQEFSVFIKQLSKAVEISIKAQQLSVDIDYCIDCAYPRRFGRDTVKKRHDILLVRNGDVNAEKISFFHKRRELAGSKFCQFVFIFADSFVNDF